MIPMMMMMMRRSSRDGPLIGRRLLGSTGRDRDQNVLPASSPPLTDRVEPVSTPMTMMMMVMGLLHKVAGLLEVRTLIGRTYKEMTSEC